MAKAIQRYPVLVPNPENYRGPARRHRGLEGPEEDRVVIATTPFSFPVSWLLELYGPVTYLRAMATVRRRVRKEMKLQAGLGNGFGGTMAGQRRNVPRVEQTTRQEQKTRLRADQVLIPGDFRVGRLPLLYGDLVTVFCFTCQRECLAGRHADLLAYLDDPAAVGRERYSRDRLAGKLPTELAVKVEEGKSYCPRCLPKAKRPTIEEPTS